MLKRLVNCLRALPSAVCPFAESAEGGRMRSPRRKEIKLKISRQTRPEQLAHPKRGRWHCGKTEGSPGSGGESLCESLARSTPALDVLVSRNSSPLSSHVVAREQTAEAVQSHSTGTESSGIGWIQNPPKQSSVVSGLRSASKTILEPGWHRSQGDAHLSARKNRHKGDSSASKRCFGGL